MPPCNLRDKREMASFRISACTQTGDGALEDGGCGPGGVSIAGGRLPCDLAGKPGLATAFLPAKERELPIGNEVLGRRFGRPPSPAQHPRGRMMSGRAAGSIRPPYFRAKAAISSMVDC